MKNYQKFQKYPEYILYKSENDKTIVNNYYYSIIIRWCVIGSLIYKNKSKSKFVIKYFDRIIKFLCSIN